MRRARFDRLLTSTALAVGMALLSSSPYALAQSAAQIEAGVPMPESANMPPLTRDDVLSKAPTEAAPQAAVAPAPAVAPTPAVAAVPDSAAPVAEKLRELAAGRFDRLIGNKKERAAVEAFYSGRAFAPLWIANGAANESAKAAIAYLLGVEADALDPADYPTPDFKLASDPDALAEAEIKLTSSVLTFARHAQIGRIHFTRISGDIFYNQQAPEAGDVLAKIANSNNVGEALDSFNPPQPGYQALKAKLAEARKQSGNGGPAAIEHGAALKTGKVLVTDPRVPHLRKRLGLPDGSDITYDKELEDAVAKFQKQHGIAGNGQLNSATIAALNGPRRDRDDDIIAANMERWRWMPRDLGKIYVMVNIPDYTLSVVKDGALYWKTKIVVGKPGLATPLISAEMKFITVNPTWNVPPSIIEKEYLPALQADPQAMDRIGLKVVQDPDGTVRIFQPPGDRNALGRIRFNFPNKFLVYQHDTPDKQLFAHDKRAYSHGCMRVQDPLKYGEVILSLALPAEGYTQERLRKMFGGSEININFPAAIPVHLTYQTAFVDEDGKLQIRDDVYGRDARAMAQLKGAERKVADIPIDRPANPSAKPVKMPYGSFGGGYGGGGNFFEWLFGGSPPPVRRPVPGRRVSSR